MSLCEKYKLLFSIKSGSLPFPADMQDQCLHWKTYLYICNVSNYIEDELDDWCSIHVYPTNYFK